MAILSLLTPFLRYIKENASVSQSRKYILGSLVYYHVLKSANLSYHKNPISDFLFEENT